MHAEVVIRQPDHPERVVVLERGETRIGRAEDNEIVLSDVGVSRHHARILIRGDRLRVEDLGSGNGTWRHDERIDALDVEDGDEIAIDPFVLTFRLRRAARSEPPRSEVLARLELLDEAGHVVGVFPVRSEPLTLGRSEERDVVVPDPAASRHHCTVFAHGGSLLLRDEGSANGLLVNGTRVGECALVDGDVIRIGNTDLRVVRSVAASDEPPTHVPARDPSGARAAPTDVTLPPTILPPPPPDVRAGLWPLVAVAALVLAAVALGATLAVVAHLLG